MSSTPRWAVIAALVVVLAGVVWWMREEIGTLSWLWEEEKPSQIRVERDQAHGLFDQANVLFGQGRYEEARMLYLQAAGVYERVIDDYNRALVLDNLGTLEQRVRRYPEAASYYREALEIFHRRGERRHSASVNRSLGDVSRAMNKYEDAREFYRQARAWLDPARDQQESAWVALVQGVTEEQARALDAAADFYAQAAALAVEVNDPLLLGSIAEEMARVERQRNHPAQARELLENALTQYGTIGDQAAQTRVRADLAQLAAERKPAPEPRN